LYARFTATASASALTPRTAYGSYAPASPDALDRGTTARRADDCNPRAEEVFSARARFERRIAGVAGVRATSVKADIVCVRVRDGRARRDRVCGDATAIELLM